VDGDVIAGDLRVLRQDFAIQVDYRRSLSPFFDSALRIKVWILRKKLIRGNSGDDQVQ
jgi:hypothetical protein